MTSFLKKLRLVPLIVIFASSLSEVKINDTKLNFDSFVTKFSINNEVNDGKTDEDVFSYKSVLETYYKLAIGNNLNPTITFDDFYTNFYSDDSTRDLYASTLSLAYDNGNYDSIVALFDDHISSVSSSSSDDDGGGKNGKDAYYILKDSSECTFTPASYFCKAPCCNVYNYSSLKTGDIIYETENGFIDTGHTAIITSTSHKSSYGNYIQTIEAVVDGGVQRGFLDDYRMVKFKCYILRAKGRTDSNAADAIYFSNAQVGKEYSLRPFELNKEIDSTSWYCSELTYAAWYYAGIDIGVKKDVFGDDEYLSYGCWPRDINNSYNTENISISETGFFLSISIVRKNNNIWTLSIHNNTSKELDVIYNTKMCKFSDAQNWTNLNDLASRKFAPYSTISVSISENYLSTSVAVSFVVGEYRCITYADSLDATNKTLKHYSNIVAIKKEENED